MTEDFHTMRINNLEVSIGKLGERTGDSEKRMAVHENECANRYKEIAGILKNLEVQITQSSKKQVMLTQVFGYGIGGIIAAFQAAKALGWF
jgi:hypothetical protein